MGNNDTYGNIEDFTLKLKIPSEWIILFKSMDDCNKFFSNFYQRNNHLVDDLLDYRDYKINKDNKVLSSFIKDCNEIGLKEAFQNTFYQYFDNSSIELISHMVKCNKLSLIDIFKKFKANPDVNILKYIL